MAAVCDECGWTGSAMQVLEGGRCPECEMRVRYDSAPVSSTAAISGVFEFNCRVLPVLRSIRCTGNFVPDIIGLLQRGHTPTEGQQQALYRVINRHRRQVADKAVADFATYHARGTE